MSVSILRSPLGRFSSGHTVPKEEAMPQLSDEARIIYQNAPNLFAALTERESDPDGFIQNLVEGLHPDLRAVFTPTTWQNLEHKELGFHDASALFNWALSVISTALKFYLQGPHIAPGMGRGEGSLIENFMANSRIHYANTLAHWQEKRRQLSES